MLIIVSKGYEGRKWNQGCFQAHKTKYELFPCALCEYKIITSQNNQIWIYCVYKN